MFPPTCDQLSRQVGRGGGVQRDVAEPGVQRLSSDVSGNHFLTGSTSGASGERAGGRDQRQQDQDQHQDLEGGPHLYTHTQKVWFGN